MLSQYGCGTLHAIALNGVALLHALPPMAHFRAPLLAALLRDLSLDSACQIAAVASSTLKQARAEYPPGNFGDLTQTYPTHVSRSRLPASEVAALRNWIKDQCVPKSGTRYEHYEQLLSSAALYDRYRSAYGDLLLQLIEHVKKDEAAGKAKDPAINNLMRSFHEHEREFAFLAFVHTATASASAAFAGGNVNSPTRLVLEYLCDVGSPLPAPLSRPIFERVKNELPLSQRHAYWGKWDCSVCANGPQR